jgi:hypothetical protein
MGRSATLCRQKNEKDFHPAWETVREHRQQLNENLAQYLQDEACVEGVSKSIRGNNAYLDLLSEAYVSVLVEELENTKSGFDINSTVSFAIIYTELWRQATLIDFTNGTASAGVGWMSISNSPTSFVETDQLQALNRRWGNWQGNEIENAYLLLLARNLANAYLKAYEECRVAAQQGDPGLVRHHVFVLGDILHEMLNLHAVLIPKNAVESPSPV